MYFLLEKVDIPASYVSLLEGNSFAPENGGGPFPKEMNRTRKPPWGELFVCGEGGGVKGKKQKPAGKPAKFTPLFNQHGNGTYPAAFDSLTFWRCEFPIEQIFYCHG